MDYLDFELKIGKGSGREYAVEVVRSPAGERRATMRFPYDELELESRLKDVEIALLKSGSTRRAALPVQERRSVKEFGQDLFEALLSDEVRTCYRLSRQKAGQEGKGLRLRLRIEAPELAALPWEFLYDDVEGDYVCLSTETPILRYLEMDRPPEALSIAPPLRVLGMVASPDDLPELNVEREKRRMEVALQDLTSQGLVSITWLEGQTWRDLQKALRGGPWHVFHFVGHGGFDTVAEEGTLALADENGRTFRLGATKLGRLLSDHNALRLAILNACEGAHASEEDIFSSTASMLIRRGIPAVVAMQYEISDRAAIEFTRVFYEALADGMPVDAAVTEARKAISMAGGSTFEWGTPVLHMRSPDGRLFDVKAAPPASPKRPLEQRGQVIEQQAKVPVAETIREAPAPAKTREAPPEGKAVSTPRKRKASLLGGAKGYVVAGVVAAAVVLGAVFLLNKKSPPPEDPVQQLLAAQGFGPQSEGYSYLLEVAQVLVRNRGIREAAGYDMNEESLFMMFNGQETQMRLELQGGVGYEIHGFCDKDCEVLSLRLLNDAGAVLVENTSGDEPVVGATPPSTQAYLLYIEMSECEQDRCVVGLGLYSTGAPATTADAPPQTDAPTVQENPDEPQDNATDARPGSATPQNVTAAFELGNPFVNEDLDFAVLKPIVVTLSLPDEGGDVRLGVDSCLLYSNQSGTRVIRENVHPETGDRFLTSVDEGQFFAAQQGFEEGTAEGQIFRSQQPGTVLLALYWNDARNDAIVLANPDTRRYLEANGYRLISEEGYVYPADRCQ